ncbi:toll/interleukin-1 receptor domain-containing protein [Luteibacter aegosomatissinici]|uniref:toll/interleukin-1 receptor domain-containing protein n=1 Tax=Luteibacter aegosomatissinici TaxID=2911539 RepID=UPI001FFAB0BD|nr:toll/interleukin-1 receptor domain-containing protein [Luteibacter aegosomatissinici]UPG96044.1 TIR domain-containing protein [Luteibacter aegosomatissinici]
MPLSLGVDGASSAQVVGRARVVAQRSTAQEVRYRAFISYSHRDKAWARWLHRALESYPVPHRLVGRVTDLGTVPKRLAPIFRDTDELATARDLGQKVSEALAQSASLLVVCSPEAALSRWVDEEIRMYQRQGGAERIFCLVVAGEPNASRIAGRGAEECFPPALRQRYDAEGNLSDDVIEPLAADVRPGGDGKHDALCKLVAGMLGVGLDELKRRDLQRRAKRAVAISAVAVAVMVVTIILAINATLARRDAVAASRVAERRQKDAEDLVAFMLGDLNDKLAQVSRLDILEAVDDRAMAYFQAQPTNEVSDRALLQRATALEKIGSVRLDQGRLDAALASYEAARNVAAELVAKDPAHIPRQVLLAEVVTFMGMVHWRQARLDDAQRAFADARAILAGAEKAAPDNNDLHFQLAMLDNNMGRVMEARGAIDDAETHYRDMLARMQRLSNAAPNDADVAEWLGSAHYNLGKLALLRGEIANAIAQYAADETIQARLSSSDPKDANRKDNLLTVQAILGRAQALAGDVPAGVQRLQRAVDAAHALVALDATNTDAQEHVALFSTHLARLRRLAGDADAARALIATALPVFIALRKQDPHNAAWQREYAEARTEEAAEAAQRGDTMMAAASAREAMSVLEPLLAAQPADRATLLATLAARLAAADVAPDVVSRSVLRDGVGRDAAAVTSARSDPRLIALQVEALLALGRHAEAEPLIRTLWSAGYRDLALVQQLRRARIDYPVNQAFQRELVAATAGGR